MEMENFGEEDHVVETQDMNDFFNGEMWNNLEQPEEDGLFVGINEDLPLDDPEEDNEAPDEHEAGDAPEDEDIFDDWQHANVEDDGDEVGHVSEDDDFHDDVQADDPGDFDDVLPAFDNDYDQMDLFGEAQQPAYMQADQEEDLPDAPEPDDEELEDVEDEDAAAEDAARGEQGRWADPTIYTPSQLLEIPFAERWKLNLVFRNLRRGELEAGRIKYGRRITWLFEYEDPEDESYRNRIFFFTQSQRFGGPPCFMSNHHKCDFTVCDDDGELEADGHTFTSMEQFYQYSKALVIAKADERHADILNENVSSKDLPAFILGYDNPNRCADAGRGFDKTAKEDAAWAAQWQPQWEEAKFGALRRGTFSKFDQNKELAYLLMMTGDHELVKASHKDPSCGIGRHASVARYTLPWGANKLGRALEEVRDEMRAKYGVTEGEFAFWFWRTWEELLNNERYIQMARDREYFEGEVPEGAPLFDKDMDGEALRMELDEMKNTWVERNVEAPDEGIGQ